MHATMILIIEFVCRMMEGPERKKQLNALVYPDENVKNNQSVTMISLINGAIQDMIQIYSMMVKIWERTTPIMIHMGMTTSFTKTIWERTTRIMFHANMTTGEIKVQQE